MRYLPAAMTPVSLVDVGKAAAQQFSGDQLSTFETSISRYLDLPEAYSYTSFMRAIFACLSVLRKNNCSERNQVVLSRYSCPSFVHAIQAAGLEPAYCDMIPETLSMDLKRLVEMDFSKILVVFGVNFFGLSNRADELVEICSNNGIFYVEGLDYSLGSEYDGKKVGTFGDFGVLNFQEGKTIPVSGGMLVTKHPQLMKGHRHKDRKQRNSNIAMMCGYSIVTRPLPYYFFMKTSELIGTNIRKRLSMEDTIRKTEQEFDFSFDTTKPLEQISSFQATLGTSIFKRYELHIGLRKQNADYLRTHLNACPGVTIIKPEPKLNKIHYVRFPILVRPELRPKLIARLADNGIEASTMYSDHGLHVDPQIFPGAARVMNELLTLPCHPGMQPSDLKKTVAVIKSCTEGQ